MTSSTQSKRTPDVPGSAGDESELVRLLACVVAERPDAVAVSVQAGSGGRTLRIAADAADHGRIIGRNGRMIRAIRVLAGIAAAAAHRDPVRIDIV